MCLPRVCSPVLCKFWWLYGGDNGDLLQEGLWQTQVCCTQSHYHCCWALLTHISARDTQTQFCLSLCGVFGSWCTQGMFETSECLWRVCGLILNLVKAMVFSVVMCGCESWTIKKAEHQRIDAFELWCWRRLLRVPWKARRSNQSILKEISPEYSWKD